MSARLWWAAVVMAAAAACVPGVEGALCQRGHDEQCPTGQICVGTTCSFGSRDAGSGGGGTASGGGSSTGGGSASGGGSSTGGGSASGGGSSTGGGSASGGGTATGGGSSTGGGSASGGGSTTGGGAATGGGSSAGGGSATGGGAGTKALGDPCATAGECAAPNGCFAFYPDADHDGATDTASQLVCAANASTPPSQWFGTASGGDCDDTDNRAHPGASFQTMPMRDGGFDFNCNGTLEPQYLVNGCSPPPPNDGGCPTQANACTSSATPGWKPMMGSSAIPTCGTTRAFLTSGCGTISVPACPSVGGMVSLCDPMANVPSEQRVQPCQ